MQPFYDELDALARFHPAAAINRITLHGNFSRGKALDTAARSPHIRNEDIIFFVDVDITFNKESLDRIRLHTVARRQVYLPIVFSEYDPARRKPLTPRTATTTSEDVPPSASWKAANLDDEVGYFRQFGYGICAIYKADIMHASLNGFNTDIAGWGLEDVRFLEQIVKLNLQPHQFLLNLVDGNNSNSSTNASTTMGATKMAPSAAAAAFSTQHQLPSKVDDADGVAPLRLDIFRAPDVSLVHVYHAIECDRGLDEAQYKMCVGTKANTLGSYAYVEERLLSDQRMVEHFRAAG